MVINSNNIRWDGQAWLKTSLPNCNDGIDENSPYLNINLKPNIPAITVITPQIAKIIDSAICPVISSTVKSVIVFVVSSKSSVDELRLFTTMKYDGNAISNNIAEIGIINAFPNFPSRAIIFCGSSSYYFWWDFFNIFFWGKPVKKENQLSVTSKSDFLLESPIKITVNYIGKK